GRFPSLEDRDDLWRILVTLTVRKSLHHARDARRLKRGGGAVPGETDLAGADDSNDGLAQALSKEPTPELAAEGAEAGELLLKKLGDDRLRQIALWKMEGDTNAEIAARLGCADATVERRLALIRRTWRAEGKA